MQHSLSHYPTAKNLMAGVRTQMDDHLMVRIDEEFEDDKAVLVQQIESETNDDTLSDLKKELGKRGKRKTRDLKDVGPVVEKMYPLQIRMIHLETNLSFLLENAHNRVSYPAIARYYAEYAFLAERITKLAKSVNNDNLKRFLDRSLVLEVNYFDAMKDVAEAMCGRIAVRMATCPEQYIDLDPSVDAEIDAQAMAEAFKAKTKDLKEEFKKH